MHQAGYALQLAMPEGERFIDDKLDIVEGAGMQPSMQFTLTPSSQPPDDMMAYLRLIHLKGAGVSVCVLWREGGVAVGGWMGEGMQFRLTLSSQPPVDAMALLGLINLKGGRGVRIWGVGHHGL